MGAGDMFDIPTVLSSDEILDKAFRKASKVDYEGRTKLDTVREINIAKAKMISAVIVATMGKYVKAFPRLEELSPFYSELVDMSIGRDRLKKSLGAMDWCRGSVATVSRTAVREMGRCTSIARIDEMRRSTYGRVSSFVKQVGKELDFLANARDIMKRFPTIDPKVPTVVIAGAPNVGKSQLVGGISTAKPRVAVYPFTTQEITVGSFERKYLRYQIIDTPGILDRPLEQRNPIELRAILALRHLSQVILFILDPTESCGSTVEQQERLLNEIKSEFASVPVIVVENKSDMLKRDNDRLKMSALTGDGVPELIVELLVYLKYEGSV
jgi:nucleolar GTP-binding protein